ncbi:MAG TPA: hypothetical protein PKG56_03435 [Chitinophagaceae bacterium]|nr:hypothetical protein [Chitinophagaceae bacterium]HNL82417.1 hypothetical protein [Chitinophagaceae bacterium]
MGYKNAMFLLSILISFVLYGQKKIIFKDNFVNNKNRWKLEKADDEFSVRIKDKALYFKKNHRNAVNNGCLWFEKNIRKFKAEKNFIITFYAKILSSDDVSNGFDFQWGKIEEDTNTSSSISTSLYQLDFGLTDMRLSKFDNINGWTYYDWSDSYTETLNYTLQYGILYKYEIIQRNDTLTVLINDKIVYALPIKPQDGKSIGVQQCLKSHWLLSRLSIKQ